MSYTPQNTRMNTVDLDFGHTLDGLGDTARATVAATWVAANSIILVQASGTASDDHDPEDALLEEIVANVDISSIIPGVSFDVQAYAPNGTWGIYTMSFIGLIRRVTT